MKRGLPFAAAFTAVILAGPTLSRASDHLDGPETALDQAADISDMYSFTSPQDPTKLVLVMNVHGYAGEGTEFSDAVQYRFRIREVDPSTMKPGASEQDVTCTFAGGGFFDATQDATCRFDLQGGSDTVTFKTRGDGKFRAGGAGAKGDLQAFAGVRSDTWFLDLGRVLAFNQGKKVDQTPGSNGLANTNVLSIVVEMDKRRVGGPLLAVTAQTVRPQ